MRVVIFGLSVSSTWGNGHGALWRALIAALLRDGHQVVFYERDTSYYSQHRDLHSLPEGGTLVLYRDFAESLGHARKSLREADVGVVTSYCPDGVVATQLLLDSRVKLRCFYDLDTPITLARIAAGEQLSYIGADGLGPFDLVLSYTGGKALDALCDTLGARRAVPLYGSVDPAQHYKAAPDPHYRAGLSYLGTYAPDRQRGLKELFVDAARQRPTDRFVIGGAQYPHDFPWTENIWFVRHVPVSAHPVFYSSSRWTLNVTREPMARMGWCPSGRLFEAAACGAPIISDEWEGLDAFFEPGREIIVAAGTEDTLAAMELSDAERDAIAARARERVLAEHTAARRAREMIAAFETAAAGTVTAA